MLRPAIRRARCRSASSIGPISTVSIEANGSTALARLLATISSLLAARGRGARTRVGFASSGAHPSSPSNGTNRTSAKSSRRYSLCPILVTRTSSWARLVRPTGMTSRPPFFSWDSRFRYRRTARGFDDPIEGRMFRPTTGPVRRAEHGRCRNQDRRASRRPSRPTGRVVPRCRRRRRFRRGSRPRSQSRYRSRALFHHREAPIPVMNATM